MKLIIKTVMCETITKIFLFFEISDNAVIIIEIGNIRDMIDLEKMDDDLAIEYITKLKGLGVWSAQMFLMFNLNRPDIFPTKDVGLIRAISKNYKASYPPGEAREDWVILKDLANMLKKPLGVNTYQSLREAISESIKSKIAINTIKINDVDFIEDEILIKPLDYYYTNPIARSSKVMSECRQISKKFLFTGIEKAS